MDRINKNQKTKPGTGAAIPALSPVFKTPNADGPFTDEITFILNKTLTNTKTCPKPVPAVTTPNVTVLNRHTGEILYCCSFLEVQSCLVI